MTKVVWGIVGNSHDAGIGVFNVKRRSLTRRALPEIYWAGKSSDFSMIPGDSTLHPNLINKAESILGWPDEVIWYERPFLKTARQFLAGQGFDLNRNDINQFLLNHNDRFLYSKLSTVKHHHSHAAYAHFTSPQTEQAIMCLDSIGEFESFTIWYGSGNNLKQVYSLAYPHSLGLYYSAMTQRCGLIPQFEEHRVVELGNKGNEGKYLKSIFDDILDISGEAPFKLKMNLHRGCKDWNPEIKSEQDIFDLAAAAQAAFEMILGRCSDLAKKLTGCENLALAGGCALNRRAVREIDHMWKTIHIPKNPGDAGSCIGAVLSKYNRFISLDGIWHDLEN